MQEMGVWRDYEVDDESRVEIAKQYGLHDLQLRAFDGHHRLPQAIESDDWLVVSFLVPHVFKGALKTSRLHVLVGDRKVITLHEANDDAVEIILERVTLSPKLTASPTGVLAVVADAVTELFTPVIDYIDTVLDNIEDKMIAHPTDKQLHQLFHHKKLLVEFRRVVLPTTALLDALSDGRHKKINQTYAPYIRDSYNYSWRTHELIDTLRDLLSSALDTYLSVVSNRMNEVMKRLTVVTTFFMPISFLAGFGGMNFTGMPFSSNEALYGILALMVIAPLLMIWWFRRKRWL